MIQVNKDFLQNEQYVSSLIEQAKKQLNEKQRRYNRYTRNNKRDIDIAIEYYIVNIASGYFGGIPPNITVKQEEKEENKKLLSKLFNKKVGQNANADELQIFIDHIREMNDDGTVFYEMVKDYFITGTCYALQYETVDNNLRYARVSPLQTVALYNYETPVDDIGVIRIWQETDVNGDIIDVVEIITSDKKTYFQNSVKKPKEYKLNEEMTEDVNWLLAQSKRLLTRWKQLYQTTKKHSNKTQMLNL